MKHKSACAFSCLLLMILLLPSCNSGGGGAGNSGGKSSDQSAKISSSAIQTNSSVQAQVQNNITEVNQAISSDTSEAAQPAPPEEFLAINNELTLTEDELALLSSMQEEE